MSNAPSPASKTICSRLQLDARGKFRHFLAIEGLPQNLLLELLDTAESFVAPDGGARKIPLFRGKTVVNLFFEPSTRTRSTFELAAKRLSADVMNFNVDTAAVRKGESLIDTIKNIQAMGADMFIVRHPDSGASTFIASHVAEGVCVINAGDGRHAHPTQALLDMFTIRRHKPDFSGLSVAIVGDVLHSRVARSEIAALRTLGVRDLRLVAPRTLTPRCVEGLGVSAFQDLKSGLDGVDVVIILRLQKERMQGSFIPSENEYYFCYGITTSRLKYAKPDAIVMHPGPINRGVEISSEVADGPQSVILDQVNYGVTARMAVMSFVIGAGGRSASRLDAGQQDSRRWTS